MHPQGRVVHVHAHVHVVVAGRSCDWCALLRQRKEGTAAATAAAATAAAATEADWWSVTRGCRCAAGSGKEMRRGDEASELDATARMVVERRAVWVSGSGRGSERRDLQPEAGSPITHITASMEEAERVCACACVCVAWARGVRFIRWRELQPYARARDAMDGVGPARHPRDRGSRESVLGLGTVKRAWSDMCAMHRWPGSALVHIVRCDVSV